MVLTVLSACIDLPGASDDATTQQHYVDMLILIPWMPMFYIWTWKWRHNNCITFLWSFELQASSSLKFDHSRGVMFYTVFCVLHVFNHNVFLGHYDSRHDKLRKQYEHNWIGKHKHIQVIFYVQNVIGHRYSWNMCLILLCSECQIYKYRPKKKQGKSNEKSLQCIMRVITCISDVYLCFYGLLTLLIETF